MIELRMDRRIAARTDPSDVVQETLLEAHRRLDEFLRERPMPFYAWLRQLAWQNLVAAYRKHMRTKARSVLREREIGAAISRHGARRLSEVLLARGPSPSARMQADEDRERVLDALNRLSDTDREILLLRLVEQLSTKETAAVLEIAEGTVGSRQFRALKRLKRLLDELD